MRRDASRPLRVALGGWKAHALRGDPIMVRLDRSFAAYCVLQFLPVAVAGSACEAAPDGSRSVRAAKDDRATAADAGQVDGGEGDASEEGSCARGTLPLLIKPESDAPDAAPYKLYVPATTDGQSVVFLLDTGSPYSFLHEPWLDGGAGAGDGPVADAGSAVVGCDRLTLWGVPDAQDAPFGGRRVAGTLGDEHLLTGPVRLDFGSREVIWHDPGVPFAAAAAWPSAPFDRPGGVVRIHDVAFDGAAVQMFVDTGTADSVWLGQQGQPGDTELDGEDVTGAKFKMYLGTATVTIGRYQERVPVYRVPSFPYLQQAVDALHGQLNGIFGLSAFSRGIVFDTDANVVRIAVP